MTTPMTQSAPELSVELPLHRLGVDIDADQALLSVHPLPKLHARLQQALRRRAFAWGVSVGAAAALVVCGAVWGAFMRLPGTTGGSTSVVAAATPTAAPTAAAPVVKAEAPLLERTAPVATCPPQVTTPVARKPPPAARQASPQGWHQGWHQGERPSVSAPSPSEPQTSAPPASDPFAASRLRTLLTLYALAEDALRMGEIGRAADLVAQADAMAAGGPIGAEFAALREQIAQARHTPAGEPP